MGRRLRGGRNFPPVPCNGRGKAADQSRPIPGLHSPGAACTLVCGARGRLFPRRRSRRLHHSKPGYCPDDPSRGIGNGKHRLCRCPQRHPGAGEWLQAQDDRGQLREGAIRDLQSGQRRQCHAAKQLEGLTLGSGAGSFTPKVIEGFMAQQGLDSAKLKITNVAPSARASALLAGQVPAIEFFVMAKPGLESGARDAHAELRTFLLSDHGLDLYSNGLAVGEDYLAKNGEVVRAFVRAALKGWKLALADPQRAAQDELKYVPSLKPDLIVAELAIVGNLAVTPDVKQNGLGWFDPNGMKSALDFVVKYVGMTGTAPAAADLYAPDFLPAPAITP